MKNKIHLIKDYMSWTPHTIGVDIPISTAKAMMRDYRVRHLPVLSRGKLVGVVSERNVTEGLLTKGGENFTVDDIMTPDPYTVEWETSLAEVVDAMADEKFGCAIIEDKANRAIGIFTTVDACRALNGILEAK